MDSFSAQPHTLHTRILGLVANPSKRLFEKFRAGRDATVNEAEGYIQVAVAVSVLLSLS